MKKTAFEQTVDELNHILDAMIHNSKTETLSFQRGYLTGWLARLAHDDPALRREIHQKFKDLNRD